MRDAHGFTPLGQIVAVRRRRVAPALLVAAGTQAALEGFKIAETPREMARVAKLAEKEGSKTRAILKTAVAAPLR
jgi:hypothetical protein